MRHPTPTTGLISRPALLTVAAIAVAIGVLAGCTTEVPLAILETRVIAWPGDDGSTVGQVIATVRNDDERPIDPDVLGRGELTYAALLDGDGNDLSGGDARVQLHAVPHILDPGETGYLIGTFDLGGGADVADARIEVNTGRADARASVSVEGFELTDDVDGVGGTGRLEWDGAGTAVARAIALDAEGRAIGYMATSEVRYDAGDFTMCCFPPTVDRDEIDEVLVFGDQTRDEN